MKANTPKTRSRYFAAQIAYQDRKAEIRNPTLKFQVQNAASEIPPLRLQALNPASRASSLQARLLNLEFHLLLRSDRL